MFVSKWSDFYAKDSTNLWQTSIKWLTSIREPLIAGTEGFQWKLKYPAGLNRVTNCIKMGPLVPFFKGGGGCPGTCFPRKFWNFKALKCDFQHSGNLSGVTKERVFHSRKCSFHSTFDLSVTINSYKQWTDDENLCKPTYGKKLVKIDWNIAFTWLKPTRFVSHRCLVKPLGTLRVVA